MTTQAQETNWSFWDRCIGIKSSPNDRAFNSLGVKTRSILGAPLTTKLSENINALSGLGNIWVLKKTLNPAAVQEVCVFGGQSPGPAVTAYDTYHMSSVAGEKKPVLQLTPGEYGRSMEVL